ncbi:MAG: glutamine synthetase family protein, partial [Pseudomonadota bacterium]
MAGKLDLEALRIAVEVGDIDTVVAALPDMQGRLMGKRFQAEFFLDSAYKETHGCNYLLATDMEMETVDGFAATSWAKGYGDYTLKADLSTLRRTPWLEGTALVLCDVYDHHGHALVEHAPRTMLRRQVERLSAQGLSAIAASELEFFVFADSFEAAAERAHAGLRPISAYNEDYHIFQTTKEEGLMRAIRTGLQGADIPVENSKGEAEAGQEEINVRYTDALTMADRHSILKNAVKEIAWAQGRAVTFMAKWSYDHAGSSSHIHMSLRRGAEPLFHDPAAPHGMSAEMRSFMAGILAHADAITLLLA